MTGFPTFVGNPVKNFLSHSPDLQHVVSQANFLLKKDENKFGNVNQYGVHLYIKNAVAAAQTIFLSQFN